jgi:hypothetical protein
MVEQTLSEYRAAEGPADERSHHRVSQRRAPLSPNQKIAVDTVINVKVILIGLTSEVKRPPLA